MFYVVNAERSRPTLLEIRAMDVTTSKIRSISRFEASSAAGLSVSPDGKTILLAVWKAASDLTLIENFQ